MSEPVIHYLFRSLFFFFLISLFPASSQSYYPEHVSVPYSPFKARGENPIVLSLS